MDYHHRWWQKSCWFWWDRHRLPLDELDLIPPSLLKKFAAAKQGMSLSLWAEVQCSPPLEIEWNRVEVVIPSLSPFFQKTECCWWSASDWSTDERVLDRELSFVLQCKNYCRPIAIAQWRGGQIITGTDQPVPQDCSYPSRRLSFCGDYFAGRTGGRLAVWDHQASRCCGDNRWGYSSPIFFPHFSDTRFRSRIFVIITVCLWKLLTNIQPFRWGYPLFHLHFLLISALRRVIQAGLTPHYFSLLGPQEIVIAVLSQSKMFYNFFLPFKQFSV